MSMRFFEEYGCGCVSKKVSRNLLPGYCAQHGADRKHVYRADGLPADEKTIARAMELRELTKGES